MPLSARVRLYATGLALLALAACAHSEPFQDPNETSTGPFSPDLPLQLTYNIGLDLTPVFLPGDSLLLYSFNRPGGEMLDQCLAALPVTGGTTVNESCPKTAGSIDSVERYAEPAVLNDTTIAYVQDLLQRGGRGHYIYLGTAPWRNAFMYTALLSFPYSSSSNRLIPIVSPTYTTLPGNDQLAFIENVTVTACPGFVFDCMFPVLLTVGYRIAEVPIATPDATALELSNTEFATAAAPGRTPGSILFTLPFDTRVYERSASGAVITLFDFGGSSQAARDPVLRGNRLVAVINGAVTTWVTSPDSLIVQTASGGDLGVASLSDGTFQTITGGNLEYSRPALSADGRRILVQGSGNIYVLDVP